VAEAHNTAAWDRMARRGHVLAQPATDAELARPLQVVDPIGWLGGDIHGWQVLCLAAGGGRHGPLYRAAGAEVTVVDLSPEMLALDRQVAAERGLELRTIQASMVHLPMLVDQQFDLVIHPVSTCYVEQPVQAFAEVARLLRPGGLYISQHKQPINLQASLEPIQGHYVIEQPAGLGQRAVPARAPSRLREPGTIEFIHPLEVLLGGMCRCGLVIEDVVEPRHGQSDASLGSFAHRCHYVAPYLRIKARRRPSDPSGAARALIL
jgi:SAM-dependent methyltransferase